MIRRRVLVLAEKRIIPVVRKVELVRYLLVIRKLYVTTVIWIRFVLGCILVAQASLLACMTERSHGRIASTPSWVLSRIIGILRAEPFYYICGMPFFTKSNLVDLRAEAEQLSICVEHFLYASERVVEGDYKTKGFYDNCIEKCNGRLKAIHFLMESIRQDRPVSEDELQDSLPDFLNCSKDDKQKKRNAR